jgi:hypothetical protein
MSKARVTTCLLVLLLSAAQAAAARQADALTHHRVALPGKDWAFDITLPPAVEPAASGPKSERDAPRAVGDRVEWMSDDGREYRLGLFIDFGTHRRISDTRMLTVTLSPAKAAGGAEAFRDYVLKSKFNDRHLDGVRTAEYGQIPVARYRVVLAPPPRPYPDTFAEMLSGASRAAQAFIVKDDVWLSVILTGAEYGARDEKLFHSLLDSLRLTDTSAPAGSFDLYHKGRVLYLNRDYRRATVALGAALELEKRERRLDRASWRSLVSTLVDAHAAARDFERAKEILDFGIAEDPTNPAFHLALAHYHAMNGNLDGVITSLEKVYLNREKGPRAALPPDPELNPAFERFRKDERFRKAVKAMRKLNSGD